LAGATGGARPAGAPVSLAMAAALDNRWARWLPGKAGWVGEAERSRPGEAPLGLPGGASGRSGWVDRIYWRDHAVRARRSVASPGAICDDLTAGEIR